jgi:hypothetical protein
MANRHLFRHSDPKKMASYAVDSGNVIEIGDQVYLEVDDVRAASGMTYGASLAETQLQFKKQFVGIAMTASASGETDPISVARAGVFEMDCAAAQFEIGDRVGIDDNGGGTALEDQQVIAVAENGVGGIGRVAKRYGANTTRVLVEIFPTIVFPDMLIPITLCSQLIQNAVDLVTDWAVPFPFKLVYVDAIVQVLTAGALTATIDNGATGLDDTITVPDASAVGVVVRTTMEDATGDDIFEAADTLTIKSDGTPTAGEVMFVLWVYPFLNES